MAVFEMKYMDDIPFNVSMDEAIELAKVFGDENQVVLLTAYLTK